MLLDFSSKNKFKITPAITKAKVSAMICVTSVCISIPLLFVHSLSPVF